MVSHLAHSHLARAPSFVYRCIRFRAADACGGRSERAAGGSPDCATRCNASNAVSAPQGPGLPHAGQRHPRARASATPRAGQCHPCDGPVPPLRRASAILATGQRHPCRGPAPPLSRASAIPAAGQCHPRRGPVPSPPRASATPPQARSAAADGQAQWPTQRVLGRHGLSAARARAAFPRFGMRELALVGWLGGGGVLGRAGVCARGRAQLSGDARVSQSGQPCAVWRRSVP